MGAGERGGVGAWWRVSVGARGRGGGWVGVGASEASAETVAPTFDHTRRERSERRDGSDVLAKMARRRRRNFFRTT